MGYGISRSLGRVIMRLGLKTNIAAACLAVVLIAANAPAAVIYFDDFSGSGDTSLNGTTPDTRPGTETWLSSANWRADGSKVVTNSGAAFLPFVPASGKIYTLSADVNRTGTGQDWLAIGFAGTANTGNFVSSTPYTWMLLRGDRGEGGIQTFLGGGTAQSMNHFGPSGTVNLKVILDTTTPLWSAQWYANDTPLRTTSFTTNPTISHVAFGGHSNGVGTVDNLTLSVVPEPGAAGLLFGAGLLALRRKRQRDQDRFLDE